MLSSQRRSYAMSTKRSLIAGMSSSVDAIGGSSGQGFSRRLRLHPLLVRRTALAVADITRLALPVARA